MTPSTSAFLKEGVNATNVRSVQCVVHCRVETGNGFYEYVFGPMTLTEAVALQERKREEGFDTQIHTLSDPNDPNPSPSLMGSC